MHVQVSLRAVTRVRSAPSTRSSCRLTPGSTRRFRPCTSLGQVNCSKPYVSERQVKATSYTNNPALTDSVPELVRHLENADVGLQVFAAWQLGAAAYHPLTHESSTEYLVDSGVITALSQALKSDNWQVKQTALLSLSSLVHNNNDIALHLPVAEVTCELRDMLQQLTYTSEQRVGEQPAQVPHVNVHGAAATLVRGLCIKQPSAAAVAGTFQIAVDLLDADSIKGSMWLYAAEALTHLPQDDPKCQNAITGTNIMPKLADMLSSNDPELKFAAAKVASLLVHHNDSLRVELGRGVIEDPNSLGYSLSSGYGGVDFRKSVYDLLLWEYIYVKRAHCALAEALTACGLDEVRQSQQQVYADEVDSNPKVLPTQRDQPDTGGDKNEVDTCKRSWGDSDDGEGDSEDEPLSAAEIDKAKEKMAWAVMQLSGPHTADKLGGVEALNNLTWMCSRQEKWRDMHGFLLQSGAITALSQALGDEDWLVKLTALEALSQSKRVKGLDPELLSKSIMQDAGACSSLVGIMEQLICGNYPDIVNVPIRYPLGSTDRYQRRSLQWTAADNVMDLLKLLATHKPAEVAASGALPLLLYLLGANVQDRSFQRVAQGVLQYLAECEPQMPIAILDADAIPHLSTLLDSADAWAQEGAATVVRALARACQGEA